MFRDDDVPELESDVDAAVDQAVRNGDEHAIKLTSACVVAFRGTEQRALLAAAQRACALL